MDITDLPDGVYALRSTVDPDQQLLEMDARNNAGITYFELSASDLEMLTGPPAP